MSFLSGNHQLLGTAKIKRVSVPNGDHRVSGSHRSHGSEVWVPHIRGRLQGHPRRRKYRLFVMGNHLFVISATCPVLSCFAVRDCPSPFSVICIALCSDACWFEANQSVCTHEMSFVCFVTEKGFH